MVNFSCHALSVRTFDKRNKLKKKNGNLYRNQLFFKVIIIYIKHLLNISMTWLKINFSFFFFLQTMLPFTNQHISVSRLIKEMLNMTQLMQQMDSSQTEALMEANVLYQQQVKILPSGELTLAASTTLITSHCIS